MPYTLPPLPYPADALEKAIDKQTMEIHHGKHHKAYVDNLNAALAGHADLEAKPIEQLMREITSVPEAIRQKVINNGGGHANHTMFWEIMGPSAGGEPQGDLAILLMVEETPAPGVVERPALGVDHSPGLMSIGRNVP